MRNAIRSSTALAAALLLAAAQPACAQSLSEAYSAALKQDPDLAAAAAERDATSENDAIAKSLFRPKAEVRGSVGYARVTSDADVAASYAGAIPDKVDGFSGGAVVIAEQPIVNGEARAQGRALRAGARGGLAQFEFKRQQLALRVATAYFDLLKARDSLASLSAQEDSTSRELRGAKARFDAGRANVLDLRESQARLDALTAQIVGAQANYDLAVSRFTELVGFDGSSLGRVRDDLEPMPPATTLADAQATAEASSPALAALRAKLDGSKAAADQYRWSSQIKVNGMAAYGQMWRGGSEAPLLGVVSSPGRVGGLFAGFRLQMPLTTGGGLEAQRRQAADHARGAGFELEAARRDVRLKVQEAWLGQRSSKDRVLALRAALASALLQERAAITGREVGVRTQSDVLAAQAQTLETRRRLNEALYDYEYARLALAAATGTLTTESLAGVDGDLMLR